MTTEEVIAALAACKTWKTDLSPMVRLMDELGHPEKGLKYIHVGGTNGKGSTCAMLASVLQQAGYRTGRFVSPYILEFRERIQMNGQMIPEEDLCRLGKRVTDTVRELEKIGVYPTEFDAVTAIGLLWFREIQCDFVVLEVGVGGTIDSTNIIPAESSVLSVITSISLDHTAILGDSESAIAREKGGIFKENGTVLLSGNIGKEAIAELEKMAEERCCTVYISDPSCVTLKESRPDGLTVLHDGKEQFLPLPGLYQLSNLAVVYRAVELLREKGVQIPEEGVKKGLENLAFPARMELLGTSPLFWIDGAHNPEGIAALASSLKHLTAGKKTVILSGMMADKNCRDSVKLLAPLTSAAVTVTPNNPRALPAQELAKLWKENGVDARCAASVKEAVEKAISLAGKDGAVVCCGSLYLCSEIRPVALDYFKLMKEISISFDKSGEILHRTPNIIVE